MSFPLRKNKKNKDDADAKKAGGVAPGAASGAGSSSGAASGGAVFPAAGSAGLGGAAPGSGLIAAASPTGAASTGAWASLVNSISQATGLSAIAASKAGIVGIVLAVSSGVAGFSFIMGNSTPTGERSMKRRVFALQTASQETTSAQASKASRVTKNPGDGSSLEYTPKITSNLPEARPEIDGPAGVVTAPSQEEIVAATEKVVDAPVAKKKKKHKRVKPGPKPQLAKTSGVKTRSSNQTTKVVLKRTDSLSGGPSSTFQDIYDNGAAGAMTNKGQRRPRFGAVRKTTVLNSGRSAMDQAKFANRMSRGGARMGRTSAAAHNAATAFDGGNATAKSLGKAEGTGLGGTGLAGSANSALDNKLIEPPPAPEDIDKTKNETPYQGMLMAAMGSLMLGTMLLMAAGKLIGQGRSNPTPAGAAMVSQGKMLAMAAMGAGGAAAGMGAMIGSEHGQMTQAIPFVTGGGILAFQAGMVLAKADAAGEEASSGIENAAGQAAQTAGQALQGMNQGGQEGNADKKTTPEPKQDTAKKFNSNDYTYKGNIPG